MRKTPAIILAANKFVLSEIKAYMVKAYPALLLHAVSCAQEIDCAVAACEDFLFLLLPEGFEEYCTDEKRNCLKASGAKLIVGLFQGRDPALSQNLRFFDDVLFASPKLMYELDELINLYCGDIETGKIDKINEIHRGCARELFVRSIIHDHGYIDSLEHINRKFCMNLQNGCYRAILVHPDYESEVSHFEILEILNERFIRLSERLLRGLCYDVAYYYRFAGFLIYINYPQENEEKIKDRCKMMLDILVEIMKPYQQYSFTVSVSKNYASWQEYNMAEDDAYSTSYIRLDEGYNRVIFSDDVQLSWDENMQSWFEQGMKVTREAIERLDYRGFEYNLRSILAYLRNIKAQAKLIKLLHDVNKDFFNIHRGLLLHEVDCEAVKKHISWIISSSRDTHSMINTVLMQIKPFFDIAKEEADRASKKPIRFATAYICDNLDKHISLSEVAEKLHFSSGYLAQLFKKETGKCFTDYVADCKLAQAKEMLKLTNLSIQEVSMRVGFSDQRYFSRWFKARTGITPTNYKKITVEWKSVEHPR